MNVRPLFLLASACAATAGFAQVELIGRDQYPQFRGASGLPGSGAPVRPVGGIGLGGAWSLTTPIAYSLGHWQFFFGGSLLSTDGAIPPFAKNGGNAEALNSNGTFWQMGGFKFGDVGDLTLANMFVSTEGDNGSNVHFRFNLGNPRVGFAAGIQDTAGQVGSAGDVFPADDVRTSRSAYGVVTLAVGEKSFVSAGWGTRRFEKGFASATHWVSDRWAVFTEFEGKHWNVGAGYGFGYAGFSVRGSRAEGFMSFGTVRGKYPFWSVGVGF